MSYNSRVLVCLSALLLSAPLLHAVRSSDDPDVVQYLNSLYDSVKDRTPRKLLGLNLLPSESWGFANIVRCFSNHCEGGQTTSQDIQLPSNQRLLQFDLSSLSTFEELMHAELVYKIADLDGHGTMSSESLQLNFYIEETSNNLSREFNLASQTSIRSDEWRGVTVPNSEIRKDHMLSVRVELQSGGGNDDLLDAALLQNIAMKLIVYTYDNVTAMGVGNDLANQTDDNESEQRTVSKRSTPSDEPSLEEMAQQTCRPQQRTLHYNDVFANHLILIQPSSQMLNFTFCYGLCDRPFDLDEYQKYSIHSKIISSLNVHPNLAPPCCIGTEIALSEIIYWNEREDILTMATFEHVTECGCR